MKKKQNDSARASALQITLALALMSVSAILLASSFNAAQFGGPPQPDATETMDAGATALATSEQKQPLDRSPGTQTAEIPSRIGYLQRQPNPPVPQLVGTNLGVELEPNNTFATANSLGVDPEGKIKGYNFSGGPPPAAGTDEDWYSFTTTVANSKIYAATMTSGSGGGADTILAVIASDGSTVLELDDQDGTFGGSSSSIAGTLLVTPGTYYLRVTNFSTNRPDCAV